MSRVFGLPKKFYVKNFRKYRACPAHSFLLSKIDVFYFLFKSKLFFFVNDIYHLRRRSADKNYVRGLPKIKKYDNLKDGIRGRVAHRLEQLPYKQWVDGSIPSTPTKIVSRRIIVYI